MKIKQQLDNKKLVRKLRRKRNKIVSSKALITILKIFDLFITISQRVLVAYCRSGKLGAAYCTLQTGELFILEEIVDRPPEYLMFLSLYRQVEPVCILLDGKNQGAFVQTVKKTVFDSDANDEGRCKLVFLSSQEYSEYSSRSKLSTSLVDFEACKRRISSLSLPTEPANCSDDERSLYLRTVIDYSQTQSVHALGALLRYLDLNWAKLSMDLHGKPQFLSLRIISLADIVTIDEDTYRGLQVFSAVAHPSAFKRGVRGSSREGLSLFQLFSRCASKLGQRQMRVLLQHPTSDLATLEMRQELIAYFMKPQSDALMRNICSSLRYIKNVHTSIYLKPKESLPSSLEWTLNWIGVNIFIHKDVDDELVILLLKTSDTGGFYLTVPFFSKRGNSMMNSFSLTLILPISCLADYLISLKLYLEKQTMASLHGLMSETAKVEMERLPTYIQECSMLYMPHLGYLLGVKIWDDNLTAEDKQLPDMKFMVRWFRNESLLGIFFEQEVVIDIKKIRNLSLQIPTLFIDTFSFSLRICELDVMIGDTYPEIVAHETRLMMRLTAVMLEHLHTLTALVHKCAELDCLIAISKVCKEFNYVRPTLSTEKIISIKAGRHPLYMLTCDSFVPNDVESSDEAGCVKILTGPNSSGKSVYMKQIGLIVYLAHVGSFVPAEAATLGVLRHIHSRIHTTECVAAHMSAFLIDLRQMALALQESTSNSLLIVDEFGKGTSATDGLALLAACLNTLLFRGDQCPHVLLATHYLQIKEYIVDTPIVRYLRFEYVIQDGEPVFLFRVCEGGATSSFALQVAAAAGLGPGTVARAKIVMESVMVIIVYLYNSHNNSTIQYGSIH
ncbi:mutS protein homolog 5-like [Spodoptera litura]|uniref:MutS protein homolog 5-like n=1 Tax=Spodoptera litura TaxID=69820 RepID=A0A9J7DZ22_SPOLT|nr:mutS protein homolog 5-like [Spodoptera litura]